MGDRNGRVTVEVCAAGGYGLPVTRHQTRACDASECGLRFPVPEGSALGAACPHCGGPTRLLAAEVYETHEARGPANVIGPPVEGFLDNLRSLRNVGSIFRTADGAGVRHLYLGGFTPTPDHPRMVKTSLGAEQTVAWSQHRDGLTKLEHLAAAGCRLWALEGGEDALPLPDAMRTLDTRPIILVVGHEVSGVDPRLVERCERTVRLPMMGSKGSLNVGVAFGVAAYFLRFGASPTSGSAR